MAEAGGRRRPLQQRLTDAVTLAGFRTGAAIAGTLPGFLLEGLAPPIGFGANVANAERRAIVEHHLRRVNPTWSSSRIRQAVQQSFDSYTRYWIENLRLPSLSARTIASGIDIVGFSQVTTALEGGNGVILALPHLGGWEWAGRWLTDQGHRVTVVVERLEPPELFEWFVNLRSDLGMTVVPLGPDATGAVMRALRNNEILCLLSDRDIQGGGVEVEFFGEVTTLPAGPATLSLRTGAPILPVAVYFTRRTNGHHGVVRSPLPVAREGGLRDDVRRVTQLLAQELEYLIRRAPEQWHLFQPNWPSDPGYAR
ncbi:MAG: phosphatidylinositol mannoside acyltransferase [Ilumatobacteraceae bacterium]